MEDCTTMEGTNITLGTICSSTKTMEQLFVSRDARGQEASMGRWWCLSLQGQRLQSVRAYHWLGKSVMFLEHSEGYGQGESRQPRQDGRVAEGPEDQ